MQFFFLFGALLHATAFFVVGFIVLLAASKADRHIRILGNGLAIWLIVLGMASAAVGIFVPPPIPADGHPPFSSVHPGGRLPLQIAPRLPV